jgi:hypothetical protein
MGFVFFMYLSGKSVHFDLSLLYFFFKSLIMFFFVWSQFCHRLSQPTTHFYVCFMTISRLTDPKGYIDDTHTCFFNISGGPFSLLSLLYFFFKSDLSLTLYSFLIILLYGYVYMFLLLLNKKNITILFFSYSKT